MIGELGRRRAARAQLVASGLIVTALVFRSFRLAVLIIAIKLLVDALMILDWARTPRTSSSDSHQWTRRVVGWIFGTFFLVAGLGVVALILSGWWPVST